MFRSQTKGPSAEGEDFVPEADGIIEVNIYDHTCLFHDWISLSLDNYFMLMFRLTSSVCTEGGLYVCYFVACFLLLFFPLFCEQQTDFILFQAPVCAEYLSRSLQGRIMTCCGLNI